jgi:hypothetical protein
MTQPYNRLFPAYGSGIDAGRHDEIPKTLGPFRSRTPIDRLRMPASAVEALARAVPTSVVQDIVRDHYSRAAPTPPAEPSLVDRLVAKFGPKAG